MSEPQVAEEWRDVPGFPGYRVSNLGRVWSLRPCRGTQERLLRGCINDRGYRMVGLIGPNGQRNRPVHALVAAAFLGDRPKGAEHIRHLDGIKLNNCLDNLVYGTRSENALDEVRLGTHPNTRKTHCLHGHLFDEENTLQWRGKRICRACRLPKQRAHKAAVRAAERAGAS